MDENEIMTEDEVMDEVEEFEGNTEDSHGFPVIPTVIGGAILAGGAAIVANRKKLAAKIAEKRAEHAKKVYENYQNRTILYPEVKSEDSEDKTK